MSFIWGQIKPNKIFVIFYKENFLAILKQDIGNNFLLTAVHT